MQLFSPKPITTKSVIGEYVTLTIDCLALASSLDQFGWEGGLLYMSLPDVMMKTTEIELGLICYLWLVTLASEFTSLSLNFFSSQSVNNNNSRCSMVRFEDYMREFLYPT